jgi:peptidyl-dipeptidase A
MTSRLTSLLAATAVAAVLAGCGQQTKHATTTSAEAPPAAAPSKLEQAEAFLAEADKLLRADFERQNRTHWAKETNITYDTEWLVEQADADSTKLSVDLAKRATAFDGLQLPPDMRRRLDLIKLNLTLPAPSREGAAEQLAADVTHLASDYSTAKIELDGEKNVPLEQLEVKMGELRDPVKLEEIWSKWHDVPRRPGTDGKTMAQDYADMVAIANEGARELGYANVGDMWLSKYDMPPDKMAAEVDRIWRQVKPLYVQLHCYVRARLNEKYGDKIVPLDQPIRADVLGNMWAQDWSDVYDLVAPKSANIGYDLTDLLVKNNYTPRKMVETGEHFYTSLGFKPLPQTFWDRSQFVRPADREVECHASAWDFDATDEVRIKVCLHINAEDFRTVHHELGHNFYQRAYKVQPSPLYWTAAHDGFHEAIGDFIALSITPEYLHKLGLITEDQIPAASADTGLLMQQALGKIAFLPFALMMDKWRWQVLAGETKPEDYNKSWWELRKEYQGVRPPSERPADAFDPGAKMHIAENVPYLRYFLSYILQFQFHQAACGMANWEGPLHRCSIYGNEEVGARFNAMLQAGASEPWPDTLELFTGQRDMDGSSIIAYFAPLQTYLEEQNKGRKCGW